MSALDRSSCTRARLVSRHPGALRPKSMIALNARIETSPIHATNAISGAKINSASTRKRYSHARAADYALVPMAVRRNARTLCDPLIVRTRPPVLIVGVGISCTILAACAAGSSGGSLTLVSGTYSAESGGAIMSARSGDCGDYPEYNADAQGIARLAGPNGVSAQSSAADALRAVLAHGSEPFFGGRGGSGVVGLGYPGAGWKEISATNGRATFQAPLHSGTAKLTLTRVGSRWLVSHLEKDC